MRRREFLGVSALVLPAVGLLGEEKVFAQDEGNIRSGDPCGKISLWMDNLVLPIWRELDAEHGFTPAEAIVYGTQENEGNVVSMLATMRLAKPCLIEGRKIISWTHDLEYDLLTVMGYGTNQYDRYRWYGFIPQIVGASYQYAKEEKDGLTFPEAFEKFTYGQGSWKKFRTLYNRYSRRMEHCLQIQCSPMAFRTPPDYYHDFSVSGDNQQHMIDAVQRFLEERKSPLADKDFFKTPGKPSIINYDDIGVFCRS